MSWCSVKGCSSGSRRKDLKNVDRSHIRFHRFPKNSNYENIWREACGNPHLKVKNAYICSLHFEESAYFKPLMETLLDYSPRCKRKLKEDAVPTIHCHSFNSNQQEQTKVGTDKFTEALMEELEVDVLDVTNLNESSSYSIEMETEQIESQEIDQTKHLNSQSLRWYLLGKHSSVVFTEHRNTQDTDEECLVDCLTASTLKSAKIVMPQNSNLKDQIMDETLAKIENDYGVTSNVEITEENLDLLTNFENELLLNENPHISDCMEYVTGSVARKFIHKYPNLGEKLNSSEVNANSSWTENINKGFLTKPSKELIEAASIMETIFQDFHTNNGLNKSPGVMRSVADKLNVKLKLKCTNQIPYEVIHCLVRTRTFIRLNNLNNDLSYKLIAAKRNKIKKFTS